MIFFPPSYKTKLFDYHSVSVFTAHTHTHNCTGGCSPQRKSVSLNHLWTCREKKKKKKLKKALHESVVKLQLAPDRKVCLWPSLCPLSFTELKPLKTHRVPFNEKKRPHLINSDCSLCELSLSENTINLKSVLHISTVHL